MDRADGAGHRPLVHGVAGKQRTYVGRLSLLELAMRLSLQAPMNRSPRDSNSKDYHANWQQGVKPMPAGAEETMMALTPQPREIPCL